MLPLVRSFLGHQGMHNRGENAKDEASDQDSGSHDPTFFLPAQLLRDAGDDAPGSTARAYSVLVGHGQQVALLDGELSALIAHALHVIGHLVIPLRLLGKLGLSRGSP